MAQLRAVVTSVVMCGGLLATGSEPAPLPIASAYYESELVTLTVAAPQKGQRPFRVGPWLLGTRVTDPQPRDQRLNLYLVSPGGQHRAEGWEDFDHSVIINALSPEGAVAEWDVYWAVVLDPAFHDDLRSEHDLLLAAQSRFRPGDLMEFEDVPGRAFLRYFLHVESLAGLTRYRGKDGSLPRLLIVPAGGAIRAAATRAHTPE